jgi:hypothetical protein
MVREKMATLRPEIDAFGQIIHAVHNGSEAFEIVERDDGYIEAMLAKGYFLNTKIGLRLSRRLWNSPKAKF